MRDAAIVLRVVGGADRVGSRAFEDLGVLIGGDPNRSADAREGVIVLTVEQLVSRCDVDGDGSVTTRDAVAILRGDRPSPPREAPTGPGDDDGDGAS